MWITVLPLLLPLAQSPSDAARIDEIVLRHMQRPAAVGLSVAVARGDEVVYSRALGKANLEFSAPVGVDTVFRIASTTKQFTAAGILRLAEEEKLAVDDPVTRFLPDFPTHGGEITLRHLLAHVAALDGRFTRRVAPATEGPGATRSLRRPRARCTNVLRNAPRSGSRR